MKTNKIRILITGGAGFLGSNLCKHYLDRGFYVIALDNLHTGRIANLKPFFDNKNFEFIKHDVTFPINLEVDQILNFACPASPCAYQSNPIHTTKTNVLGTLNMLDLAKKNNAKILQASTSEVYGNPEQHPQSEGYNGCVNPIGIRSCYDEGKRCAESLFFDFHRTHNVNIKVIRIFNTYGPMMDPMDGRVVSNFIVQALKDESLTLYGDGTQTRSFCYVDDLVLGISKMMDSSDKFIGPVNLGNPDEFTLLELANKVLQLTKSKSKIKYQPLPQDDPQRRKPDISLASQMLDWKPKINLDVGLEKTIEYFSNRISDNKNI